MNENGDIPTSYEQWRHCIEIRCGIKLTNKYVSDRLTELQSGEHPQTRQFAKLYGSEQLHRTISWFRQASEELARKSGKRHV